ncbi:UDP-2,3-diacylglucosamine diphosphatase [soil metagenome]
MHYTIMSDLHLGAGDLLEDFLCWGAHENGPPPAQRAAAVEQMDNSIAAFLAGRIRDAEVDGQQPHLLLAGDIFDLWQVRRPREKNRDALLRILGAHKQIVTALRQWTAKGGLLTFVLGNHDQPLVEDAAWEALGEVFPTMNRRSRGKPIHHFADEASGLYVEHGHQWDPFNRMSNLQKPSATCAGYRIVRYVVNPLEPMIPLLDKGADVIDLLMLLWHVGEGEGLAPWQEVARHLAKIIGRAAGPACLLYDELESFLKGGHGPDFHRVAEAQTRLQEAALQQAIAGKPGRTIGALPANFRFLASGHTHLASLREAGPEGNRIIVGNCGTWRPLVMHRERRMRITQRMTWLSLAPVKGEWTMKLEEWKN